MLKSQGNNITKCIDSNVLFHVIQTIGSEIQNCIFVSHLEKADDIFVWNHSDVPVVQELQEVQKKGGGITVLDFHNTGHTLHHVVSKDGCKSWKTGFEDYSVCWDFQTFDFDDDITVLSLKLM